MDKIKIGILVAYVGLPLLWHYKITILYMLMILIKKINN